MGDVQTTCGCGHAGAVVSVQPRVRFRCHCTKCQAVYKAAFGDGLVFRRGQAWPIDPHRIRWIRTIRASPLLRGLCGACGDPVIAHLYGIFAIVPARTAEGLARPPVDCDIYYGSRVQDLHDDVPKYSRAWDTYAGLTGPFMRVLAAPGRAPDVARP